MWNSFFSFYLEIGSPLFLALEEMSNPSRLRDIPVSFDEINRDETADSTSIEFFNKETQQLPTHMVFVKGLRKVPVFHVLKRRDLI